jgi:(1->4)-alpha-D-glucan 1-alpha-D-glucosylmutase
VTVEGRFAAHVVAFLRTPQDGDDGADGLLVVAPRLPGALMGERLEPPVGDAWGDTALRLPASWAERAWTDALTGAALPPGSRQPLSELLATLPVAVLAADGRAAGR